MREEVLFDNQTLMSTLNALNKEDYDRQQLKRL